MTIPARSAYVVVGAGIHGLSTAYHLAKELRSRGLGSGADVVVLDKCESEGVAILSGVEVEELELGPDDSVTAVVTSRGRIEVGEQLVLAPGPWAKQFWGMLGGPMTIDIATPTGDVVRDRPMWTYWNLQEGEI